MKHAHVSRAPARFAVPTDPARPSQQSPPDTASARKSTLERANAAILRGDYEGFLRFCTEDTEWHFIGDRTLRGKSAVRAYIAEVYQEPPRFEVERMVAEGDHLAAIGHITTKGADGQSRRHAYCDVWRFRAGLLVQLQAFVVPLGETTD